LSYIFFIVVPAVLGGLIAAAVIFARVRQHFGTRRAKRAAVAAFLALGLGWSFTGLFAAVGVIGGLVLYAPAHIRLGGARALLAASATYLVFTVGVGGMLYVALSEMG
jgi:hypothetical protein